MGNSLTGWNNTFLWQLTTVAMLEEAPKFVAAVALLWRRISWNWIYSGVVLVGVGFGVGEAIWWNLQGNNNFGASVLSQSSSHAFFAVVMAVWLVFAKYLGETESHNKWLVRVVAVGGLVSAGVLHAMANARYVDTHVL